MLRYHRGRIYIGMILSRVAAGVTAAALHTSRRRHMRFRFRGVCPVDTTLPSGRDHEGKIYDFTLVNLNLLRVPTSNLLASCAARYNAIYAN